MVANTQRNSFSQKHFNGNRTGLQLACDHKPFLNPLLPFADSFAILGATAADTLVGPLGHCVDASDHALFVCFVAAF